MTDFHAKTLGVHAGVKRSQFNELSEAIYLTQGFAYSSAQEAEKRFIKSEEDEYIYARYANPTVRMFEERIAALEGAEDAFATASGMAAVSGTLFSMLKAGDHIVSAKALFGSCLYIVENVLPKWGIEVSFVDGADLEQWEEALRPNTRAVFLESISNPTLDLIDISAVSKLAHSVGALVVVDNVFATPVFQKTLDLGADIVIYSATKHIDGQGRCLGGVVLSSREFIREVFEPFNKHTGGALSPFNAWVLLKGLETLNLRCNAQADSALALGQTLSGHNALNSVRYPMLENHPQNALAKAQMTKGGTVLALDVKGGKEAAFRVLNALKIVTISNNLGDAKSLVTHPATTTHQRLSNEQRSQLGIGDGLLRLSVGLEDVEDLQTDILNALDHA